MKVLILRLVDIILLDVSVFQHYQEKGEKVKTSGDSRVTKSLVEVITQTYYNFSDNPKPVINLQEMSERLKLTQQTHTTKQWLRLTAAENYTIRLKFVTNKKGLISLYKTVVEMIILKQIKHTLTGVWKIRDLRKKVNNGPSEQINLLIFGWDHVRASSN